MKPSENIMFQTAFLLVKFSYCITLLLFTSSATTVSILDSLVCTLVIILEMRSSKLSNFAFAFIIFSLVAYNFDLLLPISTLSALNSVFKASLASLLIFPHLLPLLSALP